MARKFYKILKVKKREFTAKFSREFGSCARWISPKAPALSLRMSRRFFGLFRGGAAGACSFFFLGFELTGNTD
jgi:hypothetical protein